jgi:rhamnosyltransferase
MPEPLVTLILLTLNGGPVLAETLAALSRQQLADPGGQAISVEWLAIDSGSCDGTLETLRRYPLRLHQIPPAEFGHGRTRNLAASLARGEWLIYLSQDAVPADERWLLNLTRHLREPAVAAAFGRQLPPRQVGPIETYFLEQTYPPRAFRHVPTPVVPGARPNLERIFFSNVNAALKKSVWAKCPFPEDLVMSEDQAFARAALAAGFSLVYDPEAAVIHGHTYTLPQLFRRNFDSGYSLRGIAGDGWLSVAGLGARYVWGELQYLARRRRWATMPYAILYELVKSAGFAAGRSGHRLPAAWRPHLGLHRAYWASRRD